MICYSNGPTLVARKPVTKGDIIDLCEFLENDIASFEPESVCEGGIEYNFKVNLPKVKCGIHRKPGQCGDIPYKSIRLGTHKWPSVGCIETWIENEDVIFQPGDMLELYFKSFCGAPWFSETEIEGIVEAFKKIGITK